MSDVDHYIYSYDGKQRELLLYLHRYFTEELNLYCKMRYKIPFYDGKSWICYVNALKNGEVELAFTRGNELSNDQGLLLEKGRKQVRSLIFDKLENLPFQVLNEIMQEAILLDQIKPYSFKGFQSQREP
ncbi:MAG: DUF1801 domain-containing protein [Bacteroidetes bacterium]|nr:DUF1801 domain-containing protein [Bacteroidota bacterium]